MMIADANVVDCILAAYHHIENINIKSYDKKVIKMLQS